MIKNILPATIIFLISSIVAIAQPTPYSNNQPAKVTLSNGWHLSPAGRSLPLGDLPLNLVVSPSKKYLAVTNNGQSTQSVQLIDAVHDKVLSEKIIPES